eukprot:scaffold703_cov131-Cylindrotheca_fusiformis.AAC.5
MELGLSHIVGRNDTFSGATWVADYVQEVVRGQILSFARREEPKEKQQRLRNFKELRSLSNRKGHLLGTYLDLDIIRP